MSPRARALLVAGVLAVPAVGPAAALAWEPEQDVEGTASPEEVMRDGIDVDPGGEPESLPAAPPTDPSQLGGGREPAAPDEVPAADADTDATVPEADVGDEETSEPVADVEPPPEPQPEPAPPPPEAPPAPPPEPETIAAAPQPTSRPQPDEPTRRAAAPPANPAPVPPAPQPPPVVATAATAPAAASVPVVTRPKPAATKLVSLKTFHAPKRGQRRHVVTPGQSLWSIAAALRGPDASVAEIAREVNRLWTLNEERIATGNPDLLRVGTRLKLR